MGALFLQKNKLPYKKFQHIYNMKLKERLAQNQPITFAHFE
jgi:hypothetical protein